MIQLAELGRVLAEPTKSSVHTVDQPLGGGGAEALALVVTMLAPMRTSADDPAIRARRVVLLSFRGLLPVGGDIAVPSVVAVGRRWTRSRRAGRLRVRERS